MRKLLVAVALSALLSAGLVARTSQDAGAVNSSQKTTCISNSIAARFFPFNLIYNATPFILKARWLGGTSCVTVTSYGLTKAETANLRSAGNITVGLVLNKVTAIGAVAQVVAGEIVSRSLISKGGCPWVEVWNGLPVASGTYNC